MTITLYADEHAPRTLISALRRRSVNVLTPQEDERAHLTDAQLLDRARELNRVFFTADPDVLTELEHRKATAAHTGGVIVVATTSVPFEVCVDHIELLAKSTTHTDWPDQVIYLPL